MARRRFLVRGLGLLALGVGWLWQLLPAVANQAAVSNVARRKGGFFMRFMVTILAQSGGAGRKASRAPIWGYLGGLRRWIEAALAL